eukprot:3220383-Ditylum_brightwellii.AAC.1
MIPTWTYPHPTTTEAQCPKTHGFLEQWSKQGVLLLNAALTVKAYNANSHAKKGRENFTDEIIRILDKESKTMNDGKGLVFLL